MNIQIDNKTIRFGDQKLFYNLYFVRAKEFKSPTNGGMFKKIVIKWAKVLSEPGAENSPLFLPFDPDDQWTDCLKATRKGDRIVFKIVRVEESGWAIDFEDLEIFMTSPHKTSRESPNEFAEFDKDEIISALINAEVIDEA